MTTDVDLCNRALISVGADRITALSDGTTNAVLCNTIYESTIKEVCSDPWPSIIRRQALNQTSNTPTFDFVYEFQLPTDPLCIRVIKTSTDNRWNDYVVEGDKLLANTSVVSIQYTAYITDPGLYSPMLQSAIVYRLASLVAMPLTHDSSMARGYLESYMQVRKDGIGQDSQQKSGTVTTSTELIEDR